MGKALCPLAVPYSPFQSQEISLEGYGSNRKDVFIWTYGGKAAAGCALSA